MTTTEQEVLPAEREDQDGPIPKAVIMQRHTEQGQVITPLSMISQAINSGAGIETLERLMALHERHEKSEAKRQYSEAMAQARAEIPVIGKTGEVDYTNNRGQRTHFKHETLAGIAAVIDPILAKHGLSYRFRTRVMPEWQGMVEVTCIVSHQRGYGEETSLPGPMDTSGSKNSYQAMGSALTYLQRYTLKAALGLASSNDDDAMSAAPRGDVPKPSQGSGAAGPISHEQAQILAQKIQASGLDESIVLQAEGIASLADLPADKFGHVSAMLDVTAKGVGQ